MLFNDFFRYNDTIPKAYRKPLMIENPAQYSVQSRRYHGVPTRIGQRPELYVGQFPTLKGEIPVPAGGLLSLMQTGIADAFQNQNRPGLMDSRFGSMYIPPAQSPSFSMNQLPAQPIYQESLPETVTSGLQSLDSILKTVTGQQPIQSTTDPAFVRKYESNSLVVGGVDLKPYVLPAILGAATIAVVMVLKRKRHKR